MNTIPDAGVGAWVLDQFVPHGYALAQVSTFGTGKSTRCQDVKGLGEQIGIQAAVHWLGEQNWSNGNVGLMGKSYAGTTNWEAAQNPSPHLKTIVLFLALGVLCRCSTATDHRRLGRCSTMFCMKVQLLTQPR